MKKRKKKRNNNLKRKSEQKNFVFDFFSFSQERDNLIEIQQKKLEEIKAAQKEFEDTQIEYQWNKEQKAIQEVTLKQKKFYEERRKDYLEAQKKLEAKRARTKEKHVFPNEDEEDDRASQLEAQRAQALRDLADFQKQQAMEKAERERATKERERLEYLYQIQLEDEKTREAQEYAYEMLMSLKK